MRAGSAGVHALPYLTMSSVATRIARRLEGNHSKVVRYMAGCAVGG